MRDTKFQNVVDYFYHKPQQPVEGKQPQQKRQEQVQVKSFPEKIKTVEPSVYVHPEPEEVEDELKGDEEEIDLCPFLEPVVEDFLDIYDALDEMKQLEFRFELQKLNLIFKQKGGLT